MARTSTINRTILALIRKLFQSELEIFSELWMTTGVFSPLEAAISDYRFFTKLFALGLSAEQLFDCPYGDGKLKSWTWKWFSGAHPTHEEYMRTGKPPPFCDLITNQSNKEMGTWLVPYIAKFCHPRKIKLCSQIKKSMDAQSEFITEKRAEGICSLKHASRMKRKFSLEVRTWKFFSCEINGRSTAVRKVLGRK